ncbi:hypothetical protein ACA910_016342 [Epithemia clementina (nom. ined.)]
MLQSHGSHCRTNKLRLHRLENRVKTGPIARLRQLHGNRPSSRTTPTLRLNAVLFDAALLKLYHRPLLHHKSISSHKCSIKLHKRRPIITSIPDAWIDPKYKLKMDSSAAVQHSLAATSNRNYCNNNMTADPECSNTTPSHPTWDESYLSVTATSIAFSDKPDIDPAELNFGFDLTEAICGGPCIVTDTSLANSSLTSSPKASANQEEVGDDSLPTSIPNEDCPYHEEQESFQSLPLRQGDFIWEDDDGSIDSFNELEMDLWAQLNPMESHNMQTQENAVTIEKIATPMEGQEQEVKEPDFKRCSTPPLVSDESFQFDAPNWEETEVCRDQPDQTTDVPQFQQGSSHMISIDETFQFNSPFMEMDNNMMRACPHAQPRPKRHLITPSFDHRRKTSYYPRISNNDFTQDASKLKRLRPFLQPQEETNHKNLEISVTEDQHGLEMPRMFGPILGTLCEQDSEYATNVSFMDDNSVSSRQFGRWTPAEDLVLMKAVESQNGSSIKWTSIAQQFFKGVRNNNQCKGRWKKLQQSTKAWTAEEDAMIVECRTAGMKWPDIAAKLVRRALDQVSERFKNVLDPSLLKTPLTKQEQTFLLEARKEYGNRWSLIASKIPGRSESQIKNWWHNAKQAQRRALRRLAKEQQNAGWA